MIIFLVYIIISDRMYTNYLTFLSLFQSFGTGSADSLNLPKLTQENKRSLALGERVQMQYRYLFIHNIFVGVCTSVWIFAYLYKNMSVHIHIYICVSISTLWLSLNPILV
jgi:hypothetical protein